jgi:hypothetical protein
MTGTATDGWRSETVREIDGLLGRLKGDRVRLQRLGSAFGPAAAPLLLVLFSAPFVLPVGVPGMSVLASMPLLALAFSLGARQQRIAFPRRLGRRRVAWRGIRAVLPALDAVLVRIEAITRPRWHGALDLRWRLALAGVLVAMVGLIAAPLPTGNVPAASAIIAFAVGLLRSDGLLVVLGYGLAGAAVAWNAAVAVFIFWAGVGVLDLLPI